MHKKIARMRVSCAMHLDAEPDEVLPEDEDPDSEPLSDPDVDIAFSSSLPFFTIFFTKRP